MVKQLTKIVRTKKIIRSGKGIENRRRAMTKIEAGKVKYLRGTRAEKCNKSRSKRGKEEMKKKMKGKRR